MIKHVGKMTVAAHMGDCYNYYANTMEAFENAIKAGCDMIETDVHITRDSVLVLMHDHTVDRTTDGSGKISDKTVEEMRALNAGDANHPAGVPLLEELIKLAVESDITLNIEIKEYYSEENEQNCVKCIEGIIELVEKYNMTNNVVINCVDAWILEYIYKKYGKKYMLHGFYPYSVMRNVTINPDEYLYCVCVCFEATKAHYDELREKNIEAWIGASVTQECRLALCSQYGARLITTDNPADAIEKLEKLGLR